MSTQALQPASADLLARQLAEFLSDRLGMSTQLSPALKRRIFLALRNAPAWLLARDLRANGVAPHAMTIDGRLSRVELGR